MLGYIKVFLSLLSYAIKRFVFKPYYNIDFFSVDTTASLMVIVVRNVVIKRDFVFFIIVVISY